MCGGSERIVLSLTLCGCPAAWPLELKETPRIHFASRWWAPLKSNRACVCAPRGKGKLATHRNKEPAQALRDHGLVSLTAAISARADFHEASVLAPESPPSKDRCRNRHRGFDAIGQSVASTTRPRAGTISRLHDMLQVNVDAP